MGKISRLWVPFRWVLFASIVLTFSASLIQGTPASAASKPIVQWISPDSGTRVHGNFSLIARASVTDPRGGAIIEWCFAISGAERVDLPSQVSYSSATGDVVAWSTANLDYTGCFVRSNLKQVRLDFVATTWEPGDYSFSATASDMLGSVSLAEQRTLQYGLGAPEVVWNENLDGNSIWRSGFSVTVGGKLLGAGGPLPKSVSIRAWQYKRGWTPWKTAKVSSIGKYATSFYAESNLKVELKVPKVGARPGVSKIVNVPIYGTVSISGPRKAAAGSTFYYKLKVIPKWLSSINCNLTITRFDAWGYQIGTWYYQPTIKLSNGSGSLRQKLYKYSRSSMVCDSGNAVLTASSGSSDSISTTIP